MRSRWRGADQTAENGLLADESRNEHVVVDQRVHGAPGVESTTVGCADSLAERTLGRSDAGLEDEGEVTLRGLRLGNRLAEERMDD